MKIGAKTMIDPFRLMFRLLVLAMLLLIVPVGADAQEPDGKLDWLMGRWAGAGTSFGAASEASLEVTPALDGAFVELRYLATKPASFEGRAFYKENSGGGWEARWFDSRGVTWPIRATLSGTTLTSDWGTADTERGRTVYRRLEDGRLEAVDTVLQQDGRWREFARQTFAHLL